MGFSHLFAHVSTFSFPRRPIRSLSCTHTHAHAHTCTHTYTYTHTRMYTYIHAYMHTCTHAHMHTCTHTHTQSVGAMDAFKFEDYKETHTRTYAHTHVCTHANTHTRTHTHTYTHIHTHTHTQSVVAMDAFKFEDCKETSIMRQNFSKVGSLVRLQSTYSSELAFEKFCSRVDAACLSQTNSPK